MPYVNRATALMRLFTFLLHTILTSLTLLRLLSYNTNITYNTGTCISYNTNITYVTITHYKYYRYSAYTTDNILLHIVLIVLLANTTWESLQRAGGDCFDPLGL